MTITRDDWGIAHVHGKTDADAVFGMIYAQAEDDFPRIEANYLTALGRTAEAEGEKAIWQDLRARLYVSEPRAEGRLRGAARTGCRQLMDAWADGLNYYLATHPECAAARAHAVRAVDGAELHRRQHRRRHRARSTSTQLEAFYGGHRRAPPRIAAARRRAARLQRHRHRAGADRATATRCC